MRKEDLKDGMIIEADWHCFGTEKYIKLGDRFIGIGGYIGINDVTDNLRINPDSPTKVRIIKVFKNKSMSDLEDINNDNCLELIWEREREIDWSKVPKWTKVQVDDGFGLLINAYYFEYSNDKPYCHGYTTRDKFCFETDSVVDYCTKGKCKIHPSIEVKEEWYK